jgi:hypothetical protein
MRLAAIRAALSRIELVFISRPITALVPASANPPIENSKTATTVSTSVYPSARFVLTS